jgi:hypothetical protein
MTDKTGSMGSSRFFALRSYMEKLRSGEGRPPVTCRTEHRHEGAEWVGKSICARMVLLTILLVLTSATVLAQTRDSVVVPVRTVLKELLAEEDTDGDRKITANDFRVLLTPRGDKEFSFAALDHKRYEVTGTYYLSNLLQELRLLEEAGRDTAALRMDRIFEPPVERISRSIRELYWDGLTRRIDESGLPAILRDDKTSTIDGRRYLYIPAKDTFAFDYFDALAHRHTNWNLEVVRLPMQPTPEYVESRDGLHGILSLAYSR